MDNLVALVQAYLRLNGCFTVTEYPVIATTRAGDYRTTGLRAVLTGFGCCSHADAPRVIEELIATGRTRLPNGHHIRIAVFASMTREADPRFLAVSLQHVFRYPAIIYR